jgi:hypothetical protein
LALPEVAIGLSSIAILLASFSLWRSDLRGAQVKIEFLGSQVEWTGAQISAAIEGGLLPAQVDPWLFHEKVKAAADLHVVVVGYVSAQLLNDGPRGGSVWNLHGAVDACPPPWQAGADPGAPAPVIAVGPRNAVPLRVQVNVTMRGPAPALREAVPALLAARATVRVDFHSTRGPFNKTARGSGAATLDLRPAGNALTVLLDRNAALLDPESPDPPSKRAWVG